jgi:hypothetical protein
MKFSQSTLDKDAYLLTIKRLLEDDECVIFIDTNIFALLFRLYSSARVEFFNWINPLIEKDRIKTPIWALNEYTNRFINKQTNDYFSPLKKLSTTQKDFFELSNFLKMNVDASTIRGTAYTSIADYQSDLELISEKLNKIKVAAKTKNDDYIIQIHDEIQNVFEKTVIDSDIFYIVEEIKAAGDSRYFHKLPPGFEDDKKELNLFGDLIIWKEIIEYCEDNDHKKVILLTNDNKKDWVYAPNKVKEGSRVVSNGNPEFKIADPRLVYEFKTKTESEDFYIINFTTLTKSLLANNPSDFIQLAKAQQIVSLTTDDENNLSNVNLDNANTNTAVAAVEVVVETAEAATKEYSQVALSDVDFPMGDSDNLTGIILQFKSYDWYKQNHAMETFLSLNWSNVIESTEIKDKLFVIGRNIYQSAFGGAFKSIEFIQNIRTNISRLKDFVGKHIVSGIFYEIYFNSKGEFRANNLKSTLIDEIFELQKVVTVKSSIEFIAKSLQPFEKYLLIKPSITPEMVSINIQYEVTENEYNFRNNKILTVKTTTKDLLRTSDDPFSFYSLHGDVRSVENRIKYFFAIPTNQVTFVYNPTFENGLDFNLEHDKTLGIE